MPEELNELVDRLRVAGSDWEDVEVKNASGGLPTSIGASLSALANLPGGGLIILGLDEATGFTAVGLEDAHRLKQALTGKARSLYPPAQVSIREEEVDGKTVIVAVVQECPASQKPCKDPGSGKAWIRSYDGDYEISSLEEQAFLVARNAPIADHEAVDRATLEDLDSDQIDDWQEHLLEDRPVLAQFTDRMELLRRAGIITSDGVPTVAGMMVFGRYPQQYFPQLVLRAAAIEGDDGIRASNVATFEGSIPVMLEQAMNWARRSFRTRIVETGLGQLVDEVEYPLLAYRELVANALVHRDYSQWSRGLAVEVRMESGGLIISNPGGLYGVTLDRLGVVSVTSARNQQIVNLCQVVRQPGGPRVIEAIATGIQRVFASVRDAGLPDPRFWDTGIRFTARLDPRSVSEAPSPIPRRSTNKDRVADALARTGTPLEVSQIADSLGLPPSAVRTALSTLVREKRAVSHGGRGKRTTYEKLETLKSSG